MKRGLTILLLLLTGCVAEEAAPTATQYLLDHADPYLNDASYRRTQLEESLWMAELPYARKRLAGYALEEGGWDALYEISHQSEAIPTAEITHLVPDETPKTEAQWLELGERVFWSMPMRQDNYLEWLTTRTDLWEELGFQTNDDGSLRGIVRFRDTFGDEAVGATCGLCHGDGGVAGRSNRELDLGRGRALYLERSGVDGAIYKTWGAGRVDVTDDDVVDAIAVPDLWGVAHQSHLNASGAVKMSTPAALAIRFETQYIIGHGLSARPNRVLTWALAMYVLSLKPPQTEVAGDERGARLFDAYCASCHLPSRGYAGGLVPAEALGSDPQVSHSVLRGTGFYKTPSLIGVRDGGPFLHDGSVATMEELLNSDHPIGLNLSNEEQRELLKFLGTL